MTQRITHAWQRRLLIGLCWFLALEYAVGAVTKFWPGDTFFGPAYSVKFVDWGYPSWFRFVVGAGEFVSAVLLVLPRRRFKFMGAAILVVTMVGAVITHILNQDSFGQSVMAPVHLVLTGAVAWVTRPANWRELFHSPRAARVRRATSSSLPSV